MANGHGGARSGAGRKGKPTIDRQETMRGVFEMRVNPDRWAQIVDKAVAQAVEGDSVARAWLTPWVVGAEPKAVTVVAEGKVDVRVQYVDEAAS